MWRLCEQNLVSARAHFIQNYELIRLYEWLLQMIRLLCVISTVFSLLRHPDLVAKAAADDRDFGAYPRYIDNHNYGYLLQFDREINIAMYDARLIFHMVLPTWDVQFDFSQLDCRSHVNQTLTTICELMRTIRRSVSF